MQKGITPIVATVILLLVVVAIAGAAYTYITGFWGGLTSNVLELRSANCNSTGGVTIYLKNVGTGLVDMKSASQVLISRSVIAGSAGAENRVYANTTGTCTGAACLTVPQGIGIITDAGCGTGVTCRYTVVAGGVSFDVQVTCA